MQSIELRHQKVVTFERQFKEFRTTYQATVRSLENVKDLPRMVERTLPILTHFQICEAMRHALGDLVPKKLGEFERAKLLELQKFNTRY